MSYEQIGRLTPAQLKHEMGGDEREAANRASEILSEKRGDVFRCVCDYFQIKPGELRGIHPTDLAAMIKRVAGMTVDARSLPQMVDEFCA
jgi:hypothetical protein